MELFFICLFQIFVCSGKHQLDPVQLIYLTGAGIIVDGHDVCQRILSAELLDDTFADHVIRQTAEGLCADNVRGTAMYQLQHLSGQEPALTGLIAKRHNILRHIGGILDSRRRNEMTALLKFLPGGKTDLFQEPDTQITQLRSLFAHSKHLCLEIGVVEAVEEEKKNFELNE